MIKYGVSTSLQLVWVHMCTVVILVDCLVKSPSLNSEVRATNGSTRRTMDILAMALKYLIQHMMGKIQENLVRFVLSHSVVIVI